MRLNIITFYYTNNYGALLQSLCLKNFLEENTNHKVVYNHYQPKDLMLKEIFRPLITKNPKKFFGIAAKNFNIRKWKKKIDLKKPNFTANKFENNNEICIYGSDEIWNFKNAYFGFDPFFFGKNNPQKKISYAPSIGISKYDDLSQNQQEVIKSELSKFNFISVRDKNTFEFVEKILNIQSTIVVDPTLLCTPKLLTENVSNKIPKYKYAVIYGTIFSNDQIKQIRSFCEKNNISIISIGYLNKWVDKNLLNINPTDFFQIILNSTLVFTSMFHGIMFSVKLKKNFWFSVDPIRKNKINHFINELNLKNREINQKADFFDTIDYDNIYIKLDLWIENSKKFLISSINELKND